MTATATTRRRSRITSWRPSHRHGRTDSRARKSILTRQIVSETRSTGSSPTVSGAPSASLQPG